MINDLTHWLIKDSANYAVNLKKEQLHVYNNFMDSLFRLEVQKEKKAVETASREEETKDS